MSRQSRFFGAGVAGAAALGLALTVAPADAGTAAHSASTSGTLAPLSMAKSGGIKDSYIVMLKKGQQRSVSSASSTARAAGATIKHEYKTLGGYSAQLNAEQLKKVRADKRVAFVTQSHTMKATDVGSWGQDRVDQQDLPLDQSYTAPGKQGEGVTAYIIDTGINLDHDEYKDRLVEGFDAVDEGGDAKDCNGHGSHVAGTVGGSTYGLAPKVKLSPVRVLDCEGSGSNDGVVAGMDWVAENHQGPSVANMSLGGSADQATDEAVARMHDAGVTVAVAAGNETQDACDVSPAREPKAITTGSTTDGDELSDFSNFGECVDINAPGSDITSAWMDGTDSTNTISGTSMASPHVAGAAALVLSDNTDLKPDEVAQKLTDSASKDKIGDPNGSPNLLLYVGGGSDR